MERKTHSSALPWVGCKRHTNPDLKCIDVDDNYKNYGIGSQLMKRGIELMKKNGYNQFYLNASPMGFKGLGTMDLVEFYKKFGFKELLNQGHNVLMGVVF